MLYATWCLLAFSSISSAVPINWAEVKDPKNLVLWGYDTNVYEAPVLLPGPVNTLGWEDSVEVSWDGTTLIFLYTPLDLYLSSSSGGLKKDLHLHWPTPEELGKDVGKPRAEFPRILDPKKGVVPDPAYKHDSQIMSASIDPVTSLSGNVTMLTPPVNTPDGLEGCANIDPETAIIYFSRSKSSSRQLLRSSVGIQRSSTGKLVLGWSTPTALPSTVNKAGVENDNPFAKGGTLYFERGLKAQQTLTFYKATLPDCKDVVPLTFLDKPKSNETQIWVNPTKEEYLYTRDFMGIYSYENGQEKVVLLSGALLGPAKAPYMYGIGEPSKTKDGDIYFLVVWRAYDNATNEYFTDTDVAVMRRKR